MCFACSAMAWKRTTSSYLHEGGDGEGGTVTHGWVADAAAGGEGAGNASGAFTQGSTGDARIDGVLSGFKWTTTALTWRIPTQAEHYDMDPVMLGIQYGDMARVGSFLAPTAAMTTATTDILNNMFGAVSGLSFTQAAASDTSADMSIGRATTATGFTTAYAYYPTGPGDGLSGDSWFSDNFDSWGGGFAYNNPIRGGYAWTTYIHEYGHNMGLKHGHETGGPGNTALPADRDSMEFSVMTYRSYVGGPTTGYVNEEWGYAQTLMMYDIAALQAMYGADFTTNSGNSVYTFSTTTGEMFINGVGQGTPGGNRVFLTIWDGGGTDTYDFSNYTQNQLIDLRPGMWSLMSTVQQAGLGDGNFARGNVFNALQFGSDARSLIENANGGSGNDDVFGNAAVNVLRGNGGNDKLYGFAGNDFLFGDGGNDRLDGGTGADEMSGGANNDLYIVDDAGDKVFESVGGGIDEVAAGVSWVLAAGQEVEKLATFGSATTANINLTGNEFAQQLVGNAGNNRLDGKGGADRMTGFGGNDTYIVDNVGDLVIEAVGGGTDQVASSVTYALAGGQEIESLTTLGSATTANINLTGNEFAQSLVGNAGNNRLDGKGGADKMYGHAGDDIFIVDNAADQVFETVGNGNDQVATSISFTLAAGQEIEKLTTLGSTSVGNFTLTGNEFAQSIVGNAGNNVINGKAGSDKLYGMAGADTFVFDTALGPTNIDFIGDFNVADDTIRLENAIFTGLAAGTLAASAFTIGAAATTANHRIIYNSATGALFFDADGNGAGAAVRFATLTTGLAMTNADFVVV